MKNAKSRRVTVPPPKPEWDNLDPFESRSSVSADEVEADRARTLQGLPSRLGGR